MKVLEKCVLILKKLLLPGINPKIDKKNEGEFNSRMFLKGLSLENIRKPGSKSDYDKFNTLESQEEMLGPINKMGLSDNPLKRMKKLPSEESSSEDDKK